MTIKDTIESYRKRRKQMLPVIIGAAAVLLVVVGIIIVVVSLSGGGGLKLFATKTPTPTITPSPTITPLPTATLTITPTETITPTATASAPFDYVVQDGDTLFQIVQDRQLGNNGIVLIFLLNPYNPTNTARPGINPMTGNIFVGQTITLPPPNFPFPTTTPIPTGLAPGSRIPYFVMPGDSLGLIAAKFNSTVDAIVQANKTLLTDGASSLIYPGWTLLVPINVVTPVPTVTPTATATP
jgi:LysM repeat protein